MLLKIKAYSAKALKTAEHLIPVWAFKAIAMLLVFATVMTAFLCAMHIIRVSDGNRTYEVTTFFSTADSITKKIAGENDYTVKSVSKGFHSTEVVISYYFPLTVTYKGETNTYTVTSGRLGDILAELGVNYDEYDMLSISPDEKITDACVLDIVDVEYKTETEIVPIPYGNTVVYSDKYYSYTEKTNGGKQGSKKVTASVMYVDGVATSKTVLSEEVVKNPENSKTIVGTRAPQYAKGKEMMSTLELPSNFKLDSNGVPVNYKSVKTLRATAYTHTGNRCSTGVWPEVGYIAVDPKEIPYGTKMYIVSADGRYNYGFAIAADTGGFIKGDRTDVDLFMDTESQCLTFGRRDIVVYFL